MKEAWQRDKEIEGETNQNPFKQELKEEDDAAEEYPYNYQSQKGGRESKEPLRPYQPKFSKPPIDGHARAPFGKMAPEEKEEQEPVQLSMVPKANMLSFGVQQPNDEIKQFAQTQRSEESHQFYVNSTARGGEDSTRGYETNENRPSTQFYQPLPQFQNSSPSKLESDS